MADATADDKTPETKALADKARSIQAAQAQARTPAPRTVLTASAERFEITTDHWGHLPRGMVVPASVLGKPDNIARLIHARCIRETTASITYVPPKPAFARGADDLAAIIDRLLDHRKLQAAS